MARNASFHDGVAVGVLLGPLKLAFGTLVGFFAILLLAWTIDWIFVFQVWPEGVERLQDVLATDLAHAITLEARQGGALGAVTGTANFLYGVVFRTTGVHDMALRFAEGTALSVPDTILRNAYVANREAVEVAMIGTQLLGVRVAMMLRVLAMVLLIYSVAVADGLTLRSIRRACGGRESGSLYRRAKQLQFTVAGMAILAALVLPAPLDGMLVGPPLALVVGALARMQWACYKKHI